MPDMQEKIALIVPCYNEALRLDMSRFQARTDILFLFVNDGSKDRTADHISQYASTHIRLLDLQHNCGKAEAVRQGMLALQAMDVFDQLDWIGFWDADLSTPLEEIDRFIRYAGLYQGRVDAILGSRVYRLGAHIQRSPKRHFWGRAFTTVACTLLPLDSYDSQCGAKLFRKGLIKNLFAEPFLSRWLFDIEIILRLKASETCVIEYPIQSWKDITGGKLNVLAESLKVFRDLLRIRAHYGRKR